MIMFNFTGLNSLLYLLRKLKEKFATKQELDEVFTSVSNGKQLIASAITDKGVETQNDATFSVMAENIKNIPSGVKVPLKNVNNPVISFNSDYSSNIIWNDPEDEVVNGVVVSEWNGTKVVRKLNSIPENENDGDLVVDSKVKNQFQENGFIDEGLELDLLYNYGFYPYSKQNAFNEGLNVEYLHTKLLKQTLQFKPSFIQNNYGVVLNPDGSFSGGFTNAGICYYNNYYRGLINKRMNFPEKLDKNLYNKILISYSFTINLLYSNTFSLNIRLGLEKPDGTIYYAPIHSKSYTGASINVKETDLEINYSNIVTDSYSFIFGIQFDFSFQTTSSSNVSVVPFYQSDFIKIEISNEGG